MDPLQRPGQTAACYSVHGAVARYSILLIPQRHRRRGAGDKQCLSAYSVSAGPFAWRSIRNSWARRPIPPLGTKAWEASSSATTSPRPSGRRWRAATFPRASRRPDRISFSGSEQERAGVARGRRLVYEDHTPYPDGADREITPVWRPGSVASTFSLRSEGCDDPREREISEVLLAASSNRSTADVRRETCRPVWTPSLRLQRLTILATQRQAFQQASPASSSMEWDGFPFCFEGESSRLLSRRTATA